LGGGGVSTTPGGGGGGGGGGSQFGRANRHCGTPGMSPPAIFYKRFGLVQLSFHRAHKQRRREETVEKLK
jgi:hypothetical protein